MAPPQFPPNPTVKPAGGLNEGPWAQEEAASPACGPPTPSPPLSSSLAQPPPHRALSEATSSPEGRWRKALAVPDVANTADAEILLATPNPGHHHHYQQGDQQSLRQTEGGGRLRERGGEAGNARLGTEEGVQLRGESREKVRADASLEAGAVGKTSEEKEEDEGKGGPEAYEREHVHGVYEAIAPHFSATRHRPWPLVADFLRAQRPGAVGLDVGCGNGKYLGVNEDIFLLGSDRSSALVALARQGGDAAGGDRAGPGMGHAEVLVADGLALPFRRQAADFAICVAVVHHLSTRERRQDAVRKLLQSVRPGVSEDGGGRVLVYVWALEQGSSRRGWDEGGEQDLLVPWVMRRQCQKKTKKKKMGAAAAELEGAGAPGATPKAKGGEEEGGEDQTFQRYYHLYRKGELEEDVLAAGGVVLSSGYEKDNWWAIAARVS